MQAVAGSNPVPRSTLLFRLNILACLVPCMLFKKLLIANRGEVALRIMRTCDDMGLPTVAIFSEPDRLSPHVRYANEAYCIGPAPALQSYLSIERVIATAKLSGADAIHPGYGFLSENAQFADACKDAGIVFVGPDGRMIRTMGDKIGARSTMETAGVPVVPGGTTASPDDARALAKRMGYPVIVKPAGGGGGKGMHIVREEAQLEPTLRRAASEAGSSFGNPTVYLEKYLSPVRHIEVQVVRDSFGNTVHLGERECSVQRRHQKIIEESPSVAVDPPLRERMTASAKKAVEAADYVGVGTIEFLLDKDRNFYFLEMNTRLQVEHTVTEQVTGIDMVQDQILIAQGLPLPYKQENVRFYGAAVECRISAEDPYNNFMPSPGVIELLNEPGGPGVRVDTGVSKGFEVPLYYDPLISKVIAWGQTRDQAIRRMNRALRHYKLLGIKNNIPFLLAIIQHPEFRSGALHTGFLEEHPALFQEQPMADGEIAAIAAVVLEQRKGGTKDRDGAETKQTVSGEAWRQTTRGGSAWSDAWR